MALSNLDRKNHVGHDFKWNRIYNKLELPCRETTRKKCSIGAIYEYVIVSFTFIQLSLSAAKFQAPWFSFRIISSPFLTLCPYSGLSLSPLCCKMVNMPSSLFLFLKIMCHRSHVLPKSKTPRRFLSPTSIRPWRLWSHCPIALWHCPPELSQHLPCTNAHPAVPSCMCLPSLSPLPRTCSVPSSCPFWEDSSLPNNHTSQACTLVFSPST